MRMVLALVIVIVLAMAGVIGYIRFAPFEAARWHMRPAQWVPDTAGWANWVLYPPAATDGVQVMNGGAYVAAFFPDQTAAKVLTRLNAVALATPRTRRVAGSVEAGLITWETRSKFWGFPDYTTAEIETRVSDGQVVSSGNGAMLYLAARLRFGSSDFGVNAARLADWLHRIGT